MIYKPHLVMALGGGYFTQMPGAPWSNFMARREKKLRPHEKYFPGPQNT